MRGLWGVGSGLFVAHGVCLLDAMGRWVEGSAKVVRTRNGCDVACVQTGNGLGSSEWDVECSCWFTVAATCWLSVITDVRQVV